jgi:hypothetical protein
MVETEIHSQNTGAKKFCQAQPKTDRASICGFSYDGQTSRATMSNLFIPFGVASGCPFSVVMSCLRNMIRLPYSYDHLVRARADLSGKQALGV